MRNLSSELFNYFSYMHGGERYVAYCQESAFEKRDLNYRMITEAEFNEFNRKVKFNSELLEMNQRNKLKFCSDGERSVLN